MTELFDAVHIREGYVLSLLRDLIREPSVEGSEAIERCHEIVASRIDELNVVPECMRFDGRPVTFARVGEAGRPIMFAGHLDVVPAVGEWSYPPFDLSIAGERLFGRGVVDMKAGIAAFVGALRVLADLGALDRVGIELVLTSDEEVGSAHGMIPFLHSERSQAVAAVCAEPTDLAVFHGNRGLLWAAARIRGRGGHAGQAHLLSNPVPVAAKIITRLSDLKLEAADPRFNPPNPSLVVTRLAASTDATNVVPDDVTIAIDRRLLPGEEPRSAIAEIEHVLRDGLPTEFHIDLMIEREWPPYVIDASSRVVRIAMNALGACGLVANLGTDLAANDSSWLAASDIPPVLLGPGEPGLAHVTDESMGVDQLHKATEVFVRLALDWAKKATA